MINKTLIRDVLLLSIVFFNTHQVAAAEAYDPSATVYRFQETMAKRGNAESQFKLGLMFETGSGVEQGLVNAITWYNKAAEQNYKPAINRLTYLEIKKSGFKKSHNKWVKNLQADARFNEGEALFLLGQMYSEGTGIKKDLPEALRLLRKASRGNIPGADAEIYRIEKELAANKKIKAPKQKRNIKIAPIPTRAAAINASGFIPSPSGTSLSSRPKKPFITAEQLRKQQARGRQIQLERERQINLKTQQLGQTKPPHKNHPKAKPIIKLPAKSEQKISLAKNLNKINTTEKNTKKTEEHPMDIICGGSNMLLSGCR